MWVVSSLFTIAQSIKPYDDNDYELAFTVLIASGELQDAWKIAEQAVRQRPQEWRWRKRLAQVSEWIQKPSVAYQQWRYLFDHRQTDEQVLAAIKRLAVVVGDQKMVLNLWLTEHNLMSLSENELIVLSDLYEDNNQPIEGAQNLLSLYRKNRKPTYLAAAARLYNRQGELVQSLSLYEQLMTHTKLASVWVMDAAIVQVRLGNPLKAVEIMSENAHKVSDAKADYWSLLGELAWYQQKSESVSMAYQKLSQIQPLTSLEQERLFNTLLSDYPEQASDYAFWFYEQSQDIKYLARALAFTLEKQDWHKFAYYLHKVPKQAIVQLEAIPNFLLLRAQYYVYLQQIDLADRDMTLLQSLVGRDPFYAVPMLWYYLDRENMDKIAQLVQDYQQIAQTQSEMWPVLAVALHKLHNMPQAIEFYQKLLAPDADPLMLLNYADALTLSNSPNQADRIRSYVWQQLQTAQSKPSSKGLTRAQSLAMSSLSLINNKGDKADQQIRQMLQWKNLATTQADEEQKKSLIISWALETGQYAALKQWMQQNYQTRNLQPPHWAQAALALQLNDTYLLSELHQNPSVFAKLMPDVQHDIAKALNLTDHAADIAFKTLEKTPDNQGVHERLVDRVVEISSQVGMQLSLNDRENQQITTPQFFAKLRLEPNWFVDIEHAQAQLVNLENSNFSNRVVQIEATGTGIRRIDKNYQWGVMLYEHQRLAKWQSVQANLTVNLSKDLQVNQQLSYLMPSIDNTVLNLAARESQLQFGLTYQLTARERIRLSAGFADYQTQLKEHLGSGIKLDWELVHQLFYSAPDWNLRLSGAHRRYQLDNNRLIQDNTMLVFANPSNVINRAESFMPSDNDLYSACFGWGQRYAQRPTLDGQPPSSLVYTRSLRSIAELCVTHNSSANVLGHNALLGLRGTVDGEDQWMALYQESNGGLQLPNQTLRSVNLQYQRLF